MFKFKFVQINFIILLICVYYFFGIGEQFLDLCPYNNEFLFLISEFLLLILLIFYSIQNSLYNQLKVNSQFLRPIITLNQLKNCIQFVLLIIFLNPYIWLYNLNFYNHFFCSSGAFIIFKCFIPIFSFLIIKTNIFYIFIEKLYINDFFFFFGYLLFFILLLIHVNNLFLLFILLEAISLILYLLIIQHKKFFSLNFFKQNSLTKYQKFLIGFHLKSKYLSLNIFASITYFLLNILLSFFFLLGLMYIIMYFQTLSIYQLSALLEHIDIQNNKLISIAFFFILTLFLFKLGIVPFHWWVSAVFESSSIITLMFSSIPLKFSILLIFLKLFILIFSKILFNLQLILILCSLSSMLIGTLGLFQQSKLKKFWGYSTINHMGYLLLALNSFSFLGLRAFIIYSGFYILINFLFFFLIQILINETLNQRISYIHELKLLVPYKNNLLILLFTILILTSIGIPPLLGFRAKLLIISSLFFQLSQNWLIFSLCIIFITTILNAFCYLKIWKTLFLESPQIDKNHNMYRLLPIPLYHCCLLIFSCIIIFYYSYSLLFIMSKNNYKVIDDLVQIFFNYHEIY